LFACLGKTLTIFQWQSQPILSGKLLTTYIVDHVDCLGRQVKHFAMCQLDIDKGKVTAIASL